jgi:hypothetical protein
MKIQVRFPAGLQMSVLGSFGTVMLNNSQESAFD